MKNIRLIHYIIVAILVFGFGYIPPIEPLTQWGMVVLGTFLGVIYGWSTIGMIWPSFMALLCLGMTMGMSSLLSISFGNLVVVMLVPVFILVALLNKTNVTEIIANYFVSNKLVLGRPWLLIFLFLLGVYVCTIINPFVAIVLFTAFLKTFCEKVGIPAYSTFHTAMMIGFAFAAMLGQIMFPFLSTGILLYTSFCTMSGETASIGSYIIFMVPLSIVLLFCYVLLMRFVFRIDVSKLKSLTLEMLGETKKMNRDQKIVFLTFVAAVILVPLGSILPKEWLVTGFLNKLSMFGIFAVAVCFLMLFLKKDGEPLLDFSEMASKGIIWDVILMLAYIMPISSILPAENTGITAFLSKILMPMTTLPPIIFVVVMMMLSVIITNFANNAIVAVAIMPLFITFGNQVGISPAALCVLLFITTQLALATPGGSPMTGMCFAYTDLVKSPMMIKYALITIPILFIACMIIGFPYALLIF